MTDRTKPGAAFWATVVVVVALVGYPLSFGPACWIDSRFTAQYVDLGLLYGPLLFTAEKIPGPLRLLESYAAIGMKEGNWIRFRDRDRLIVLIESR